MKYVIIGNGAAGISAAEKIRKIDQTGEITILTSEKYPVYSKCLLPDFLSSYISEDRLFIRDKDFYEKNKISIYYNHRVVNANFKLKQVTTLNMNNYNESGSIFQYDKLLIATGNVQILPPVKGLNTSNSYFLSTLDEAKKIIKDSKEARRIIIIGAGFVGLEAAFNLYKSNKEVTIIERTPRILMNLLDEKASHIIQDFVQEEGIRLVLNVGVSEVQTPSLSGFIKVFTGNNTAHVILEDGRKLKADMIIVSAGSRPNLEFMKDSGLNINRGIVIDNFMQTSIKDVYAAGDVAESVDAVSEKLSLSPIWPNAVIQGETAGSNMAGMQRELDSQIGMRNASEFREVPMISMGITAPDEPGYEEIVDYRPVDMVYRKLVIKDDIVVGMIFLGDIKNAGVIGALMKNKVNIRKVKNNMLNPNFGYSEVSMLT